MRRHCKGGKLGILAAFNADVEVEFLVVFVCK